MNVTLKCLCVSEFGKPTIVDSAAAETGVNPNVLRAALHRVGTRIAGALNVHDPIVFGERTFQFCRVAGICNLSANAVVEICPKFLCPDSATWREDFLFVATIASASRLLPRDLLSASFSQTIDLTDLIARSIVSMFNRNERRPLRTYRRRTWQSFAIDGEIEPEALLAPDDEGFQQSGLLLDRENPFNATIANGVRSLLTTVRDNDTRRLLSHVALRLAPQRDRSRVRSHRLPSRHARWQDVYDLCRRLVDTRGAAYSRKGRAELPGFLIKTADAWEQLVRHALRSYFKGNRSVRKAKFRLGHHRVVGKGVGELAVFPDVSILSGDTAELIVDAKYKVVSPRSGAEAVARADIYEALAYLQATGGRRAVLIYPSETMSNALCCGSASVFERVEVGGKEILAMRVEVAGIAGTRGYHGFVENLGGAVSGCL